jgi:hypothetical protein
MQSLSLVLHFYQGSIPGVIGEFLTVQNRFKDLASLLSNAYWLLLTRGKTAWA